MTPNQTSALAVQTFHIVLSGLPASGKSTLGRAIAQALELPMLDKDDLLEARFDTHGIGDAEWRRRWSRDADRELIEQAKLLPAAVVASWWRHPASTESSGTPCDWIRSLRGEIVEIHCVCSPIVAASRFMGRTRHAGHVDGRHTLDTLLASFQMQARLGPLRVGRTITADTEGEPNLDKLLAQIGDDVGEIR